MCYQFNNIFLENNSQINLLQNYLLHDDLLNIFGEIIEEEIIHEQPDDDENLLPAYIWDSVHHRLVPNPLLYGE